MIQGAGSFSSGDLLSISVDNITLPGVSEYTDFNVIITYQEFNGGLYKKVL